MKNITARFSAEALKELRKQVGVVLDDEHDYSDDEIGNLYVKVTDEFPYEYGGDGERLRMGRIFDEIVDVLIELGAVT